MTINTVFGEPMSTVQRYSDCRPRGRDATGPARYSMVLPFAGDSRVAELQIEILVAT
ncbi:hypothetical protein [Nonomuraea sp. WAC 01424]|uniref:hypothetical protein n=1 Tax=Nonomuraea sp. WAC 01424 TaxID=2203200 RepID=UPI00163BF0C3|nr:hypothetical protein [Nonomuraea sp. WAC 01424]